MANGDVVMAEATTRLTKLEERRKQIDAQIQRIKSREQQQERKRDTRRKILIGAAVLERVKNGRWLEDRLRVMMDEFLTKEVDRRLFELPPKPVAIDTATESSTNGKIF